jgi:TolB-like protein
MIVLSAALLVRVVLVRRNTALASGIGQARIMVGVTPVRNLSSEPGQEYLADGLTDEILTQLGQLNPERLGVVKWVSSPLPSAAGFVQDSQPSPQYVMEGSVRREHERARVSVRLMRVSDATILWSDSFDRHVGDVLALQSEIAQRIGRALQIQVLPQKVRKPKSQEVVEAYLRGRFEMSREDKVPDGARVHLERAIALDPSYAPAYAGLADFYRKRAIEQDFGSESAWRLAAQYAAQALALDDESSETHVALAQINLMHDWDWRAGRQHALRALQLNPSSPDAHAVYARYLTIAGNLTDAINQREQAVALDPFRPDLRDELFIQQYFARDYQTIAAKSQRVLQEDPNSLSAHASLCVSLTHLQLFREAAAECSKELALEGHEDWVSAYMDQYRKHGFEAANSWRARRQLDETLKTQDPDFWDLANAYVLAGKREQAMEILFRGLPSHEPGLLQIRVDPDFDAIRDHPRYTELVARIGFPAE